MDFDPRKVPIMTILGVLGLAIGYAVGLGGSKEPMLPAFWGLCIGSLVALIVRFVSTWRWMKRIKEQKAHEKDPSA